MPKAATLGEVMRGEAAEPSGPPQPAAGFSSLAPLFGATRGLDPAILTSALALNLLGLALPLAVLQIYDKIGATQALETLTMIVIGLVVVALLEFGLRLAQSYSLTVDAQRLGYRMTMDAIERQLGRSDAGTDSGSMLIEKFRALETVAGYAGGAQRRDLIDLPFSGVFLLTIWLIGGVIVLAPLAVIAVSIFVSRILLEYARKLNDERETAARRRADFLGEFFGALLTVKGLGAEPPILRRFERLAAGSARIVRDGYLAAADLQISANVFSSLGSIATVGVGALMVIDGSLTAGGLAACSLLAGRAIQPIARCVGAVSERHKALIAADAAQSLFELPRPHAALFSGSALSRAQAAAPAAVALERVDHTLDGATMLDEASIRLPIGGVTQLAIDDTEQGAEMMRLLSGLTAPNGGQVLLDGAPVTERRQLGEIGIVTPNTRLFRGTIMENLTLFGALADTEDALWAVEAIGSDALIGNLPAGYDTMVTAGAGDSLSEAHLREIVLARALAQRPRLLLLDQPHIFLDGGAEMRISRNLARLRGEMTVVVRSSRAAIDDIADLRLEIEQGWLLTAPKRKAERKAEAASEDAPKDAAGDAS
ncbi:MAG: ABC transporter transmembrane domain-containing protein [Pseudomonadota bacterium]